MAVLSKAGCNLGTCHGNLNGKGGFKLSLRGADPEFDYASLTRVSSGRRLNTADPDASLVLRKPLMIVPHEGGRRFGTDSPEFRILRQWIVSGAQRSAGTPKLLKLIVEPRDVVLSAPATEVPLHVTAEFADGSSRDVSRLAVYEPAEPVVDVSISGMIQRRDFAQTVVVVRYLDQQVPVRIAFIPARPDFVWNGPEPANFIDEHVFRRLRQLQINPAAECNDTTFLRRACLDLTGSLPTPTEARQFVNDRSSDKRLRLIDDLLNRQAYADFWAQKWSDLLRVEEKTLDRKGVETFHAWIRTAIATNMPLDQFVRELVAARGSSYASPPANYYRAMRTSDMRAESTAQLFLGVRLQCAKCHNHPFDQWTQNDYYAWGNLFARVGYEVLENRRRDRNDSHEFDGEQIVWMKPSGDYAHPSGRILEPRFLEMESHRQSTAAQAFKLGLDSQRRPATWPAEPTSDRLRALANWLTAPNNRRFAEAQVNRLWFHLLGRGLVDPIDDFRVTNPASHPDLLTELADEFAQHRFDVRRMLRTIMASRTYQLASEPEVTELTADEGMSRTFPLDRCFARAQVRRLCAEQLADAVSQVLDEPIEFNGYPSGTRATQIAGVRALRSRENPPTQGDQFLTLFGKPPRLQTCECERTNDATLAQAFQLITGPLLNELLTRPNNRLGRWVAEDEKPEGMISELYWLTLSRSPRESELATARQLINDTSNRRQALEDLTWALITSNEFLLRK